MKTLCTYLIIVLAQTAFATAKLSQGPGDGGGGDTYNGKLIESFKTDITKLDEYKKHIEPILAKISPGRSVKEIFTLRDMIEPNNKRWFFVDCKLQDVPKAKKGLYMDSFQTAFQNGQEVFVDANSYAKMDSENRAQLLLHEMLMGLYLKNSISTFELCKLESVRGKCRDGKLETLSATILLTTHKKETLVAAEKVILDETAHQNIRALVDWTWSNRRQLTEKSFTKKAYDFKFSNWFTEIAMTPNGSASEMLDLADVVRGFKKYSLAKKNLVECGFSKQDKKFKEKCEIKLNFERVKIDNEFSTVTLRFSGKRISDGKQFLFEIGKVSLPSKEANVLRHNLTETESGATLRFIKDSPSITKGKLPAVGHLTEILSVNFVNESTDELSLSSVSLDTYRWYSFEKIMSKKGNINFTEVVGYNSPANELSEVFSAGTEADKNFGVGRSYERKQAIGYLPD